MCPDPPIESVFAWRSDITTTCRQPTKLQKTVMAGVMSELMSDYKAQVTLFPLNMKYLQDSVFGKLVQSCGIIFTSEALIKSKSA